MGLKKITTISLAIFFGVVIIFSSAALVIYENKKGTANAPSTAVVGQEQGVGVSTKITTDLVSIHSKPDDCWMIINSSVYNLTSFLSFHPGGRSAMFPYCGKDGTEAFATKEKSPPKNHSQSAVSLLPPYKIGVIGQNISSSELNKNIQQTKSVQINPSLVGDDDDDEDENDD